MRLPILRALICLVTLHACVDDVGSTSAGPVASLSVSADGPTPADGIELTTITVEAHDAEGVGVANLEVHVAVEPPTFYGRQHHFYRDLLTEDVGNGIYQITLSSDEAGDFQLIATTPENHEVVDFGWVRFDEVPGSIAPVALNDQSFEPEARDDKKNCKDYFNKLDQEFYPPILDQRINAENDATKKAALQRRKDCLLVALSVIRVALAKENTNKNYPLDDAIKEAADGVDMTDADTPQALRQFHDANAVDRKAMATNCLKVLGETQKTQTLTPFFGNPVNVAKYQTCTEWFNNFELVGNFADAMKVIELQKKPRLTSEEEDELQRLLQKNKNNKSVELGPDAAIAHLRWAMFALLYTRAKLANSDCWKRLLPTLAKGSAITIDVLSDHDAQNQGMQRRRLTPAEIDRLRCEYDPLRIEESDSEAKKTQKCKALGDKVRELIQSVETAKVHCKPLAPGANTNGTTTMGSWTTSSGTTSGSTSTATTSEDTSTSTSTSTTDGVSTGELTSATSQTDDTADEESLGTTESGIESSEATTEDSELEFTEY